MYSLFDRDKGDYLNTGLNSKTRKQAINDGIEFLLSDGGCERPSQIRRLSLDSKEAYLRGNDLFLEEHSEKLPDEFDFPKNRGTQRSPFGIGS